METSPSSPPYAPAPASHSICPGERCCPAAQSHTGSGSAPTSLRSGRARTKRSNTGALSGDSAVAGWRPLRIRSHGLRRSPCSVSSTNFRSAEGPPARINCPRRVRSRGGGARVGNGCSHAPRSGATPSANRPPYRCVSYSDPYGLCPPQITGRPCSGWISAGVGLIPGVGDAIDIVGLVRGKDLLTQETITGTATVATVVGIVLGSGKLGRVAGDALDDATVVVRGGESAVPPAGEVFSGAIGRTLEEAASGVPHGKIRATTVGDIRKAGGTVQHAPERTRSGVMNEKHANVCLGPGPCPFDELRANPVPKRDRIQ